MLLTAVRRLCLFKGLEGVAAPSSSLAGALVGKNPGGARGKTLIFFFLLGIAFAAFFMRFHMLQPPASDRPRPPLAHPGSVSGREDIPVPIPSRPVHPPPLPPAPGRETSALPGEDMEKTPKILCSLWERSDRLDGSKAPGQAAAGAGRGVLGDPCAHKPGAWVAARPGGVCVCVERVGTSWVAGGA